MVELTQVRSTPASTPEGNSRSSKPVEAEESVRLHVAIESEGHEMLADRGRKLKTMPGKPRPDNDMTPLGMTIHDEVRIRRARVQANHAPQHVRRHPCKKPRSQADDVVLFVVPHRAIDLVRIGGITASMVRDFEPWLLIDRKAIDLAVRGIGDKDREPVECIPRGILDLQPPQHLPLNRQRQSKLIKHAAGPGARGHSIRIVLSVSRPDPSALR